MSLASASAGSNSSGIASPPPRDIDAAETARPDAEDRRPARWSRRRPGVERSWTGHYWIMDLKFEVTVLPVADDDRAKAFDQSLGWRLDADITVDEHQRIVQFTPPGSPASIQFGRGTSTLAPGSVHDLYLVVSDLEGARQELISRGAAVSDIWHGPGLDNVEKRKPGRDPDRSAYRSFATFADPDGNSWLLQEITQRLPGRVWSTDIADLAGLLHETADHHGKFEAVAPPHDWWDWYAAYLSARQDGSSPDAAAAAAGRYMAEVKHIAV